MEQHKIRTYFLYAIGEVALVMIGILLALQVSNWNENRRNYDLENEYLIRLHEDFQLSLENFKNRKASIDAQINSYNHMTHFLLEGELPPEEFGTFAQGLHRFGKIPPPALVTGTLRELNATGRIILIRNDSLRIALQNLESTDEEYKEILNFIVERISPPTIYVDSKLILIPDEEGDIFPPDGDWDLANKYFQFDFNALSEDREMKAAVSILNHIYRILRDFNESTEADYTRILTMLDDELATRRLLK